MKYRVMLMITIEDEEKARALWLKLTEHWDALSSSPEDHANIHRCYHDEVPTRPCELIRELP